MTTDTETIISLLTEIRDELRKKRPTKKESVINDGLPEIAAIWNEWAHEKLSRVMSMSTASTRFKSCVARWKEKPDKDYWVGVVRKINESEFCLGVNDRAWKADIDWLSRPDMHARILEGKYANKTGKPKEKRIVAYWDNPSTNQREPVYG